MQKERLLDRLAADAPYGEGNGWRAGAAGGAAPGVAAAAPARPLTAVTAWTRPIARSAHRIAGLVRMQGLRLAAGPGLVWGLASVRRGRWAVPLRPTTHGGWHPCERDRRHRPRLR
jgi:hypothetical protein